MGWLIVLRRRHLRLLWLSQVLSALGDDFYLIALMWIAVKVAGSQAGLVAAAETGAMLLFSVLGGVYADRWNRRTTMISVDLLRALAVATLPVLVQTGNVHLWHLIGIAVVVGSLGALFHPALQASLPVLTGDAQTLQATNALMDSTRRLARVLGPSFVGALLSWIPLVHFFTLDALSFLISALAIGALGPRFAWKPVRAQQSARGMRGIAAEVLAAVRLVQTHRPLAWALAFMGLVSLAWSAAFTVGVPLVVARAWHGTIGTYGLLVGAYGVGNVLANLVLGSLVIRRRLVVLFSGKIVLGAGFLLVAFAPHVSIALLGAAVAAVGGPMGDMMLLMMLQTKLPSAQLGKGYSLLVLVESTGMSLGLLLAVPLFGLLSIPLAMACCALLMAAAGVIGLLRFGAEEAAEVGA